MSRKKRYKLGGDDDLASSGLMGFLYKLIFFKFSLRGILAAIYEEISWIFVFDLTRLKKLGYLFLSLAFHLVLLLGINRYLSSKPKTTIVSPNTVFEMNAIQLVDIAPIKARDKSASGGRAQDKPVKKKMTQGVPRRLASFSQAQKATIKPPTRPSSLSSYIKKASLMAQQPDSQALPTSRFKEVVLNSPKPAPVYKRKLTSPKKAVKIPEGKKKLSQKPKGLLTGRKLAKRTAEYPKLEPERKVTRLASAARKELPLSRRTKLPPRKLPTLSVKDRRKIVQRALLKKRLHKVTELKKLQTLTQIAKILRAKSPVRPNKAPAKKVEKKEVDLPGNQHVRTQPERLQELARIFKQTHRPQPAPLSPAQADSSVKPVNRKKKETIKAEPQKTRKEVSKLLAAGSKPVAPAFKPKAVKKLTPSQKAKKQPAPEMQPARQLARKKVLKLAGAVRQRVKQDVPKKIVPAKPVLKPGKRLERKLTRLKQVKLKPAGDFTKKPALNAPRSRPLKISPRKVVVKHETARVPGKERRALQSLLPKAAGRPLKSLSKMARPASVRKVPVMVKKKEFASGRLKDFIKVEKQNREKAAQFDKISQPEINKLSKDLNYLKKEVKLPPKTTSRKAIIEDSQIRVAKKTGKAGGLIAGKTAVLEDTLIKRPDKNDLLGGLTKTVKIIGRKTGLPGRRADFAVDTARQVKADKKLAISSGHKKPVQAVLRDKLEYAEQKKEQQRKASHIRIRAVSETGMSRRSAAAMKGALTEIPFDKRKQEKLASVNKTPKKQEEKTSYLTRKLSVTAQPLTPQPSSQQKVLLGKRFVKDQSHSAKEMHYLEKSETRKKTWLGKKKGLPAKTSSTVRNREIPNLAGFSAADFDRSEAVTFEQALRQNNVYSSAKKISMLDNYLLKETSVSGDRKVEIKTAMRGKAEPLAKKEIKVARISEAVKVGQLFKLSGDRRERKVIRAAGLPSLAETDTLMKERIITAGSTGKTEVKEVLGDTGLPQAELPEEVQPGGQKAVIAQAYETQISNLGKAMKELERKIAGLRARPEKPSLQRKKFARKSMKLESVGLEEKTEEKKPPISGAAKVQVRVTAGAGLQLPLVSPEAAKELTKAEGLASLTTELVELTQIMKSMEYQADMARNAAVFHQAAKIGLVSSRAGQVSPRDAGELNQLLAQLESGYLETENIKMESSDKIISQLSEVSLPQASAVLESVLAGSSLEKELAAATAFFQQQSSREKVEFFGKTLQPALKIKQERVAYTGEAVYVGPRSIDEAADSLESFTPEQTGQKFEEVARLAAAGEMADERIPLVKNDVSGVAVPFTNIEKISEIGSAGAVAAQAVPGDRPLNFEDRREISPQAIQKQTRVNYENPAAKHLPKATPAPENMISQEEDFRDLSGEQSSRSQSNLTEFSQKTFTYQEKSAGESIEVGQQLQTDSLQGEANKKVGAVLKSDTVKRAASAKQFETGKEEQQPLVPESGHKLDIPESGTQKKSSRGNLLKITVDRPSGNMTDQPLYTLTGKVGGKIKLAFVTINKVTQLVPVVNGRFSAQITMKKGINNVSVVAFDPSGGIGKASSQILFKPRINGPGIELISPSVHSQGKEGDSVMVRGILDDKRIRRAILFLNNSPIRITVNNGQFRYKVYLPKGQVSTFRVMAVNRDGGVGYSPMHTVITGEENILSNPRPF
ncbi:MAG: hypothetical protein ACE5GM_02090 [bacterium]